MKKLGIGITCYPSVGGSGIVASQLGEELAALGHRVHFISYEPPFRLDRKQPNIKFHPVEINEYQLFKYPDYTLPLAVKMAVVAQQREAGYSACSLRRAARDGGAARHQDRAIAKADGRRT